MYIDNNIYCNVLHLAMYTISPLLNVRISGFELNAKLCPR